MKPSYPAGPASLAPASPVAKSRGPAFARPRGRTRGSVLIVSMMLAGIIGISLVSYLNLSITTLRSANRSFYANSSVDYAEIGIERAMACFYDLSTGTVAATAWDGWTLDTTARTARRIFPTAGTYYTPGPGARVQVRVYVKNYDYTGTPFMVAKATIEFIQPKGPPINKWVKINLRSRSLFANGLVARNSIDWTGHPSADSWNSNPDNDPTTPAIAYSTAAGVRAANCTVGTVAAANGAINLATGSVFGSVGTGGGTVSGGSVISNSLTGTTVDPNCVSTDFSASFPNIAIPAPVTVNTISSTITATTTFPSATVGSALNGSDNTYYYNFGNGYGIDLNGGGKNIQIAASARVVFLLTNHAGVPAIGIGGNAFMNLNGGANLRIYTNGNLSMAGGGVANANVQPSTCLIYGTRTTTGQTITVSGNGQLRAGVYAPNATVTANGGGSGGQIQGSIVANAIVMHGGADFHYDEALGNLNAGAGVGVSQWRELQTAAERNEYSDEMNF